MKRLLVTVGLPGSGKSTEVEKILATQNPLSRLWVSPDHFSFDDNGHFDPSRLSKAWRMAYANLFEGVRMNVEFIAFDATLVKPDYRTGIVEIGRAFGYEVIALDLTHVLLRDCLKRNAARTAKDPVPEHIITKQFLELVPARRYDKDEFDAVVFGDAEAYAREYGHD